MTVFVTAEARRPRRPAARRSAATAARRRSRLRRMPLLPALLFIIVVTQVPLLMTIWYSLQSWNLLHPAQRHFAGFENYGVVLTDPIFRTAMLNTTVLTVAPVLLSLLIGLAIALLLNREVLGRGVLRTLIISPFLVMPAAAALIWKFTMLDTQFGLINFLLRPFGVDHLDWINGFPKLTVITVLTWQWTPFMALILLAGLQSQPDDVLEAATVDGANQWQIFRFMTLPHLRQYLELGIMLGTINILQSIDAIFMITSGGPGQATTTVPYYLYEAAFRGFDIGKASAMGVVVILAANVIAIFAVRTVVSGLLSEDGMGGRQ